LWKFKINNWHGVFVICREGVQIVRATYIFSTILDHPNPLLNSIAP